MARIVTITTLAALLLQIVPTRSPASPPDDGDRTVEIAFVAAIATASVLYAIHRHTRDPRRSNRERAEELIHYIATPEEKAELSALREDEVGPFLSRFFARRDPTPGTSDNEFRGPYMERFAYAERHFSEAGPGWKSDRGRVYILQGPPVDLRRVDLLSGRTSAHRDWKAVEIWEYDRLAGASINLGAADRVNRRLAGYDIAPLTRGRLSFVFVDRSGAGIFEQVYSTEPGEVTAVEGP